MILNRLIVPEGNHLVFTLNHTVNGEAYELQPSEMYYIAIAPYDKPDMAKMQCAVNAPFFDFDHELSEGRYVFEVGIRGGEKGMRVLLPSLDERYQPLNELLVLKKMKTL